jgi:lysozyme family protein
VADTFPVCVAFTLASEGGYVENPADPGGATNLGITLSIYRQWADDPALGPNQLRQITRETARAIYQSLYWDRLRAVDLPAGVDLSIFDMGVNAGNRRSALLLQRTVGIAGQEVDGDIGPKTLAAAARWEARALVAELAERQAEFYRGLTEFPVFGQGWLRRVRARQRAAVALLREPQRAEV